jgi:hypothetical protein
MDGPLAQATDVGGTEKPAEVDFARPFVCPGRIEGANRSGLLLERAYQNFRPGQRERSPAQGLVPVSLN